MLQGMTGVARGALWALRLGASRVGAGAAAAAGAALALLDLLALLLAPSSRAAPATPCSAPRSLFGSTGGPSMAAAKSFIGTLNVTSAPTWLRTTTEAICAFFSDVERRPCSVSASREAGAAGADRRTAVDRLALFEHQAEAGAQQQAFGQLACGRSSCPRRSACRSPSPSVGGWSAAWPKARMVRQNSLAPVGSFWHTFVHGACNGMRSSLIGLAAAGLSRGGGGAGRRGFRRLSERRASAEHGRGRNGQSAEAYKRGFHLSSFRFRCRRLGRTRNPDPLSRQYDNSGARRARNGRSRALFPYSPPQSNSNFRPRPDAAIRRRDSRSESCISSLFSRAAGSH